MAALANYGVLQHADVRLDRLGINVRKQRIEFLPYGNKFNFVLAEDMGEHTTSRAIHGIDSKFESGLSDQLQISEAADGTDVGRFQICFFDVRPLPVWHAASSGFLFDQFRDGGGRGTAEFGFELYPIPVPGIVT